MSSLTVNEILDALRDAQVGVAVDESGFFTLAEIRKATGWTLEPTKARLRALKEAGELEVTRVRRESLDGRMMPVPGYRLIKPKAKRGS
jgi:hypothetical protein